MSSIKKSLLTVLLPVLLQACAVQHQQVNLLAERLDSSTAEATLLALQALQPPERDRGQYLLNTGLLKSITGDFDGALQDLQSAKAILNDLRAISVSENFAAATINETLRSYEGSPSERVLLHVLLSIVYLMKNDLDAARVEVLQANVVMNELAQEEKPVGQLASAHYVAGLVYELGGELDDARISYRKAINLMELRNMSVPWSLRYSLRNINWRLGVEEVSNQYREQFFLPAEPPDADAAEIIVIYWDGVVTNKRETSISIWSPELNQIIPLAMPYYPSSNYVEQPFRLNISDQQHSTETIEDIEALVREDFGDELATIQAIALARMVSKYKLVNSVDNQNSSLALFANLFTVLTESADTRSWSMLPSTMQIARFALPAGEYSLPFPGVTGSQQASPAITKLVVSPGEKIVLFVPDVSNRIFVFSQTSP